MRAAVLLAALVAAVAPAWAQYSAGWTPGQRVERAAATTNAGWDPSRPSASAPVQSLWSPPAAAADAAKPKDLLERVLTSGPLAGLFGRAGVNISATLAEAQARAAAMWDLRVPLLTDDDFAGVLAGDANATWFIIITAQASGDAMSKSADARFDALYNASLAAGDLPHVRFARVDYMNVTYLTTKWAVWRAPYYVIAQEQGRSLRFFRAGQMNVDAPVLHRFLREEAYLAVPPWHAHSSFAPGGANEHVLERFARASRWVYERVTVVPRWLFMLITGTLGTALVQVFHRGDPAPRTAEEKRAAALAARRQAAKDEQAEPKPKAQASAVPAQSPAKKRKNAKK